MSLLDIALIIFPSVIVVVFAFLGAIVSMLTRWRHRWRMFVDGLVAANDQRALRCG